MNSVVVEENTCNNEMVKENTEDKVNRVRISIEREDINVYDIPVTEQEETQQQETQQEETREEILE